MRFETLLEPETVRGLVEEAGVRGPAAEAVAAKLTLAAGALAGITDVRGDAVTAHVVPGRVEVLGKHTDYCGGRSLVGALELGFGVVATPRDDRRVRIFDARRNEAWTTSLDGLAAGGDRAHGSAYSTALLRRLERNFPGAVRGADIALASDLPEAAGLSSSSALIVALYLALEDISGLDDRPEHRAAIGGRQDLAAYLAAVESGATFRALAGESGVGTEGGSEDHAAILLAEPGRLVEFAYLPLRRQGGVALPSGWVFVIAASGVRAEKTAGAQDRYNRLSRLAGAVVDAAARGPEDRGVPLAELVRHRGEVSMRDALASTAGSPFTAAELLERLEHYLVESEELVPAASRHLGAGDLQSFGVIVDRSVDVGARLLRNQVPETLALARSARELGAVASSPFGAGFGGSVWALVREGGEQDFLASWRERYRREHPAAAARAVFFASRPGPAAFRLRDDAK